MLVSEVIDLAYNTWLYPAGVGRPPYDVLVNNMTSDPSFKNVVVEGRIKTVPRDTILEIGSELMPTKAVSGPAMTVVERGYADTDVAAHSTGDQVRLNPTFPRKSVATAIKTVVTQLYPRGVYNRKTTDGLFTQGASIDLPSGPPPARRVVSIRVDRGSGLWRKLRRGWEYEEYTEWTPVKVTFLQGGAVGAATRIVYAADYDVSTFTEATDLDALGVPTGLQPYLALGAAGDLLMGKELPRVQVEEIKRMLAIQAGVQVGSALNVGSALKNAFGTYVAAERTRLADLDPIEFERTRS